MSKRFVYLLLGSRGGGRSSVVSDLVDFGLDSSNESQVFISEDDAAQWESALPIRHALCQQKRYLWKGADEGVIVEASSETVFVIADGISDPADFIDAFFNWLQGSDYELGRIITIADCNRIQQERKLLQWYDCCIHFSDVVLLSNRSEVSNKWIDEFQDRYLKEYYPCLFVFVKKGRLPNPSLVLEPEARRISKLFDEADEYVFLDDEDEEEVDEEDEPAAGDPSKDPFLAKLGNGRRSRTLPDIRNLIVLEDDTLAGD